MNDFEEKLPGEQEESPLPEESVEFDEALEEELESIREMTQRLLDGEEIPEGTEEAQDGDEQQEEEREYSEDELCVCCSERPRDFSKGDDYPYCEECSGLMKRTPLSAVGVFALIAALAVAVLSWYVTLTKYNLQADTYAVEAQSLADSGQLNSALNSYISYFSGYSGKNEFVGKKAAVRAAKLYASCGYFSDAHQLISNVFSEEELNSGRYKSMKEIEDKFNQLNTTYDEVYAVISQYLNVPDPSKVDKNEVFAALDEIKAKNAEAGLNYTEYFVEYYKYMALVSMGASLEEQYEQVKKVAQMEDAELWVYGSALCSLASKLGKQEEAQEAFRQLIEFNSEDPTAYAYYADSFRFCENPDPDKMIELLNEGLNDSNAAECYRLLAVAYLMKGDYEKAYEYSTSSYNSSYTLPGIYTHAVCAVLNEDEETYESLEQMLMYYGYSMSESVVKLKDGKLKLDDILYDAKGDLA